MISCRDDGFPFNAFLSSFFGYHSSVLVSVEEKEKWDKNQPCADRALSILKNLGWSEPELRIEIFLKYKFATPQKKETRLSVEFSEKDIRWLHETAKDLLSQLIRGMNAVRIVKSTFSSAFAGFYNPVFKTITFAPSDFRRDLQKALLHETIHHFDCFQSQGLNSFDGCYSGSPTFLQAQGWRQYNWQRYPTQTTWIDVEYRGSFTGYPQSSPAENFEILFETYLINNSRGMEDAKNYYPEVIKLFEKDFPLESPNKYEIPH